MSIIKDIWEIYKKIKLISSSNYGNLYYSKKKNTNIHILIQTVNKTKYFSLNKREVNKYEIENIYKLYSNIELYDIVEDKHNFYLVLKNYLIDLENYLKIRDISISKNEIREIFLQLNEKLLEIKKNKGSLKNLKLSNIFLCWDTINKLSIKLNYFNNYIYEQNNQINIKNTSKIQEGEISIDNSDIQNLGIIIYYLFFREYPFNGNNKEIITKNNNHLKSTNDKLLDELIERMLTLKITWDEFFKHNFFKEYDINIHNSIKNIPEFNLLCKIHSQYITHYCINCKKNICQKCFNEHKDKNDELIPLSQIGLSKEENIEMENLIKKIDNHILEIKLIKNNIKCFYNELRKFDENINYSKEKENNFKNYLFDTLNFLNYNTMIYGLDKIKNNLIEFNLQKNKSEKICKFRQKIGSSHSSAVRTIATFPSGNIIGGFNDGAIKIFDIQLSIIQNIENAHEKKILSIVVKDENNFISGSSDNRIIIWIKNLNNDKFEINQIIENVQKENKKTQNLFKVIYGLNNSLISCSNDTTIKIWEQDKNNNNKYNCIKQLENSYIVYSILLLEDKNLLISCGVNGTKFWNILNNYQLNGYLKDLDCLSREALKRIDDDRIICGGIEKNELKISSITQKKIIFKIKNDFACLGIYVINNTNAILIGGDNNMINIYNSIDYSLIIKIEKAHSDQIYCFVELKNGNIASCSADGTIRVWTYNVE